MREIQLYMHRKRCVYIDVLYTCYEEKKSLYLACLQKEFYRGFVDLFVVQLKLKFFTIIYLI